jgi:hypothetical protein
MATVGYLEGFDPLLLTRLSVEGVGTLPVSNGFDNHGKFINNLSERDGVTLIVGYLHKFLGTQRQGFFVEDLLLACRECTIPILVVVPQESHPIAQAALDKVRDLVTLVDPGDVYDKIVQLLSLHRS